MTTISDPYKSMSHQNEPIECSNRKDNNLVLTLSALKILDLQALTISMEKTICNNNSPALWAYLCQKTSELLILWISSATMSRIIDAFSKLQ